MPILWNNTNSLNININRILPARMDIISPNHMNWDALAADMQNCPLHGIDEGLIVAIDRHRDAIC